METMRALVIPILWLLTALANPAVAAALENNLQKHPSPYLSLHGADPVAWQEWNAKTVARARQEGKLLYVSIGYFSCHWCHVMQRESYRNAEIAKYLNAHFIPVKVDRELDPALDARLIEFAEKTRGISGWPLNAFVTPDGHPLYATLYHPPSEFLKILMRIEQLWKDDRTQLVQLARHEAIKPTGPGRPRMDRAQARTHARQVVDEALKQADMFQGGFGEQSKFPQVPLLGFLLSEHARNPDPRLAEFLTMTLDVMARNGLQDHLGGGFFRYTVDPSWKTPHFEKMLYDNAQLAALYLDAAHVLGREEYRAIGRRTLDFLLHEFRDATGGFIAALSALDDHGVEGGAYLWSEPQLKAVLNREELAAYRGYAGMTGAAPFDNGWLPLQSATIAELAILLGRDPAAVETLVHSAEAKLRDARARRGLPRDTKVLAAWNGLALSALVLGAREDNRYREAAQSLHHVLATQLWDGTQLVRSSVAGTTGGQVSLEDYAYVAAGLTDWAVLSGRDGDWQLARHVARTAWQRFYGSRGWRLQENSLLAAEDGQDVVSDGPMPSPSGLLITASLRIATALKDSSLRRQALAAANSGHRQISENPFWHASVVAAQLQAAGVKPP
ncbi:MAG TPA: thioredoxin domain-containing protein [Gammaproteobacteria bacterium]|nr:thioredoxin domain-containing protein [Gammaproteobacteria bacterium]